MPAGGAATLRVSTSQQAVVTLNGALVGVKRLAAGVLPSDGEWVVELRPGANTLMLRLMLHYGAYEVGGEVHVRDGPTIATQRALDRPPAQRRRGHGPQHP